MKMYATRGILAALFVMAACFFTALPTSADEMPLMPANGALISQGRDSDWICIPSGARSAYIGIHGGTMPVSLLTARDGQAMAAFVGRTGNDFLYVLRRPGTGARPPVELGTLDEEVSAQVSERNEHAILKKPGGNATILMAATPIGSVPVIYASGQSFSKLDLAMQGWLPFGLSEKPLSMEGQVGKPLILPVKPQKGTGRQALRWRLY